jgi:hypothetical protein
VLAGAEGHARIYVYDNISACGCISFPRGLDDYILTDPERFKIFFPLFSPVGIDDCIRYECRFFQLGEEFFETFDIGFKGGDLFFCP